MDTIKQIIVIRRDYTRDGKPFKPRQGKLIAQGAHASMGFLLDQLKTHSVMALDDVQRAWVEQDYRKIVCQVDGEASLLWLHEKAKAAGLTVHLVTDIGLTEFSGPTVTALAIGPNRASEIDAICGHLTLF